jgi:ribulose-phosphate 3-epimerase
MKPRRDWFAALPTDRLMAEVSLWSADLSRIAEDVAKVDALADVYHLDAADGHFSPAFLMFPDLVATIRKLTSKPLHVHLMATDEILLSQIEQFAEAGADVISIHAENGIVDEALRAIEQLGIVSGLVLQLQTPVPTVARYIERIGWFTLLGTRIGVKAQPLDPNAEHRLRQARKLLAEHSTAGRVVLAADGGIREQTVRSLRLAGADTIVMGSLAFGAPDFPARIEWVRS